MKKRKALPVLGVVFLFCSALEAQYTFKSYAAPNGGHDLVLTGINNAGRMVGDYSNSKSELRGIVIYPTGFKTISIPNGAGVVARCINNHNEITGWVYNSGRTRGFVQFQNQSIVLYDVAGSSITEPLGISDLGVRVGDFRSKAGGYFHGFVRTPTARGPVTTTIDYPGSEGTSIAGVNTAGVLAGNYSDESSGHGFLWESGQFSAIDFPGASLTWLSAINNLGEVVGGYCVDTCHGFSYYQGAFQTIDVPGSIGGAANGVNDLGVVVGVYGTGTETLGFVATPVAKD